MGAVSCRLLFLLALLFAFVPGRLHAGNNRWTSQGPEGGFVNAIAIDRTDPQTIYAATQGALWKSTNRGGSWTAVNLRWGPATIAYSVAIDPSTHNTVYAGGFDGVYKSLDGGLHWTRGPNLNVMFDVSALAIDPSSTNTIYAGTINGLYKSVDGGATWSPSNHGVEGLPAEILAIAIDPTNPSIILAGTYDGGLFRSSDHGANWSVVSTASLSYNDVVIDPLNPARVYLATLFGVYRSVDGGTNWTFASAGLPLPLTGFALTVNPAMPSSLFVGTNKGVFSSTDGADTWAPVNSEPAFHRISALSMSPGDSGRIYAGSWAGGVYGSMDGGAHWAAINSGLVATNVSALAVDPEGTGLAYLGMAYGGVWKTSDGGSSWVLSSAGIEERSITSLAVDPLAPTTIYAGGDTALYKSVDGGVSWSSTGGSALAGGPIAIDPLTPQVLFKGAASSLYKSTDGGVTWTRKSGFPTALSDLAIDPQSPSRIYAGTHNGVFKSVDSGENWAAVGAPDYIFSVKIDPTHPAVLYVAGIASIQKSSDYGASWVVLKGSVPSGPYYDLAIDPQKPSSLYVASLAGVFHSVDGGASWSSFGAGASISDLSHISIDATGWRLYAGTFTRGTYSYQVVFSLTGISPSSGPAGTPVTITGTGFQPGASVTIGGVPATDVVVHGSTILTAIAPELGLGALYDVVVSNPGGTQATLPKAFLAAPSSVRAPIVGPSRQRSPKTLPPRTPQ